MTGFDNEYLFFRTRILKEGKMRNEKGFTIVEILVALAIGAIVMIGAYSTYISQQKAYQVNEEVAALQQNLRSAMYFLERDLRMAGYNPTRAPIYFGFTDARGVPPGLSPPNLFIFSSDSSEDGTLQADERITYSYREADNTLRRKIGTGGDDQTIANNISGVSLTWFNNIGGAPANAGEIRRVEITLTGSSGEHTREMNAMVLCRNMVF